MAIDETRNIFKPSLMNIKEGITDEVWFPGVHSDIGGSYKEDELSQLTLYYMLQELEAWNKKNNLPDFVIDADERRKHSRNPLQVANFHYHGERLGKSRRKVQVEKNGKKLSSVKPHLYQVYLEMNTTIKAFKWVKKRHGLFKKKKSVQIPIYYQAKNVEQLGKGGFKIVE